MLGGGGGATAESYLLPVILGISIVSFLIWAAMVLAPTEDAMRYDEALIDHIRRRSAEPLGLRTATPRPARSTATRWATVTTPATARTRIRRPMRRPHHTGNSRAFPARCGPPGLAARMGPWPAKRTTRRRGPGRQPDAGWLLLVYRMPSEPTRLRATVWRRIKSLGAIYLQNSAAALPASVTARAGAAQAPERDPGHVRDRGPAVLRGARRGAGGPGPVPGGPRRRVRGDRGQVPGLPRPGEEGVRREPLHLRRTGGERGRPGQAEELAGPGPAARRLRRLRAAGGREGAGQNARSRWRPTRRGCTPRRRRAAEPSAAAGSPATG